MKNFRLTDETKVLRNGTIVHRIEALPGNSRVPAGTLGGWVEDEHNLSGDAWIADDAVAYGGAVVSGSALLCDDAQAYDDAQIFGGAYVGGEAEVYGCAMVYDNAIIADKARIHEYAQAYGHCILSDTSALYGDARLHGAVDNPACLTEDAKVHGGDWTESPYCRVGSIWTCNISSPDTFRLGCRDFPFKRWHRSYPAIVRMSGWWTTDYDKLMSIAEEYLPFYNEAARLAGYPQYQGTMQEIRAAFLKYYKRSA